MTDPAHVSYLVTRMNNNLDVLLGALRVIPYSVTWVAILEYATRLLSHRTDLQPNARRLAEEDPTGIMCVFSHELM